MAAATEMSAHVLRARRTAATARAALAVVGLALLAYRSGLEIHPVAAAIGFGIILGTAAVQLLAPRLGYLAIEESLAGTAGILIVGLGDQRVTVLSVLWLSAVASGVLARGGRVHWIGRAVVLTALALPMVRMAEVQPAHAGLCLASIALLLTCGRLTTELNHLLGQARYDADHDSLTDALSRAAFRTRLDERLAAGDALGLLLVDLDNFGHVNKASGHAAGDRVLVSVVGRLRSVTGEDALVGRLGGDEFAVVVGDGDHTAVAQRILAALALPTDDAEAINASVGIACAPRDGDSADALLRACDIALRVAKHNGRRQVATYEGQSLTDDGPSGARGALERLVAGDGIAMVMQPIVDPQTGRAHAYEALARFRTRGTDSPLHWFALADEFGMRDQLELACLRAALALFDERPDGCLMSVNLSCPVLLDPRAAALLAEHPDLSGLIIEITEDALVSDDVAFHEAFAPLMARGAQLAIDDMGAGYSGLRQMAALRPAYLKLDRSLVRGIDRSPDRAALVEALLHYAQRTGGHLVAEGVEHESELQTVKELGVPLVQGFYYGRPGPGWPLPSTAAAQVRAA